MSITAERKAELIKAYAQGEGDTGSPEVQVAILTERITNLTEHFKGHAKDHPFAPRPARRWSASAAVCSTTSRPRTTRATTSLIERLGLRR